MSRIFLHSLSEKAKSLLHIGINRSVIPLNEEKTYHDDKIGDEHNQPLYNEIMPYYDDKERTLEGKWPSPFDDQSAIKRKSLPSLPSNFDEIKNQLKISGTILVRFVTWNQQGQPVPPIGDLTKHLFPHRFYHIIAVGTQECENSISKSLFNPSKENWEKRCGEAVGEDYELIAGHALGGTHLALYVHRAILHLIEHVNSHAIPTGVCDKLGNKGGIAIAITIAKSKFCFLTAHLAAHQHQIERRINEFVKISKEIALVLGSNGEGNNNTNYQEPSISSDSEDDDYDDARYRRSDSPEYLSCCCHSNKVQIQDILQDFFDFIFWGGDLNFRINGTRSTIDSLLVDHQHNVLVDNDQLKLLINFDKRFAGLSEGPLAFQPTYKFDKGRGMIFVSFYVRTLARDCW